MQLYKHRDDTTFQEPVFVPRYDGAPPEDGYVLVLADLFREQRNHLFLFEASDIESGPIAQIKLPLSENFEDFLKKTAVTLNPGS